MGRFLRVLSDERLIYYSLTRYRWEWNVDHVVSETEIADNVLDMVSSKIQELKPSLQIALKSAACLGSCRFDINILSKAMPRQAGLDLDMAGNSDDVHKLATLLDQAVNEGLLEKLGTPGKYKFTHDKIRESSYALISVESRDRFHLEIGRKLKDLRASMKDDASRESDRLLLMMVYHLNLGSSEVSDIAERNELIKLNRKAADIAFKRLCFTLASNFLRAALAMIDGVDRWNLHYDELLQICTTLAHIECCCGNFRASEAMAHDAIQHARDLDDQLSAFRSLINCLQQSGRSAEAVETIVDVLQRLGFQMPRRGFLVPKVLVSFIQIRRRLRNVSDEELLNLPEASDHDAKVMDFLALLGDITITLGDSEMEAVVTVSIVLLTLERGHTQYTASTLR